MKRDFLTMEQVDVADITQLLKRAEFMESSISGQDKSLDILKGKSIVTLFYENSKIGRAHV